MNISTNYNQSFNMTGLNLSSIRNKQNQQQQVNKQNSKTMYIGKSSKDKQDNRIEELTKRKEELKERINELKTNQKFRGNDNTDPKAIKEKIEQLQSSIEEIESTITEIKQEKKEEEKIKSSSNNAEKTEEENIIYSSQSLDRINQTHSQKVRMESQANILKSEIKTDKKLKVDTSFKQEQLADINLSIKKLDKAIGKEIKKVNNENDSENSSSLNDSYKNIEDTKETNYNEKLIQKYVENTDILKQDKETQNINTYL